MFGPPLTATLRPMKRSVLAGVTAAAAAFGSAAGTTGAEGSAPAVNVGVRMVTGQQLLGIDLGPLQVDLKVTANADCRRGCDLVVRAPDSTADRVVDSRKFAPGTTQRYTVRTHLDMHDYFYSYVRLIQHTATGNRELFATAPRSSLAAEPDNGSVGTTYAGDWRRELDLAATQTMILRSRQPGSAVTMRAWSAGRTAYGVIAETGPSAGVLGIYADGALVTKVDLRSSIVTKRKVVATLPPTSATQQLRLVNLTPANRTARTVSFDGLAMLDGETTMARATTARATAAREVWGPIHLQVLNQQLGSAAPTQQVRMRASATLSGCVPDCSLKYGDKVIASASGAGTRTLSGTLAPAFSHKDPARVTLYRGSHYLGFAYVAPSLWSPDAVTYSYGWTPSSRAGTMLGKAAVSATPGTGWTSRTAFVDARAKRTVAVVTERGPGMGVMAVYKDGRLVNTIDLRSATRHQRVVVASVELENDSRVTVANVTPSGRADRTVLFDSLIDIGYDED